MNERGCTSPLIENFKLRLSSRAKLKGEEDYESGFAARLCSPSRSHAASGGAQEEQQHSFDCRYRPRGSLLLLPRGRRPLLLVPEWRPSFRHGHVALECRLVCLSRKQRPPLCRRPFQFKCLLELVQRFQGLCPVLRAKTQRIKLIPVQHCLLPVRGDP